MSFDHRIKSENDGTTIVAAMNEVSSKAMYTKPQHNSYAGGLHHALSHFSLNSLAHITHTGTF